MCRTMAANDAFTAGVRPGGLTDSTEIRLLLCYLVKNAGPITRTEIENALMEEALVNYFEIGSCLDDITQQKLVTLTDGRYTITEKPDGHCTIRCTIKALDQELFCLNIGTPDRLSADLVKKQFILKGNEIYQMLITKLTEETN